MSSKQIGTFKAIAKYGSKKEQSLQKETEIKIDVKCKLFVVYFFFFFVYITFSLNICFCFPKIKSLCFKLSTTCKQCILLLIPP